MKSYSLVDSPPQLVQSLHERRHPLLVARTDHPAYILPSVAYPFDIVWTELTSKTFPRVLPNEQTTLRYLLEQCCNRAFNTLQSPAKDLGIHSEVQRFAQLCGQ